MSTTLLSVSFDHALKHLDEAVAVLFGSDPRVQSVGIRVYGGGFGYDAVRNDECAEPISSGQPQFREIGEVPVIYTDAPGAVEPLLLVPHSGPAVPNSSSIIPEVQRQRHLVCGAQVQNFDDDARSGVLDQGWMNVGTLGCFVRLADGRKGFISNNHVLAGQNRGEEGTDRILQPGAHTHTAGDQVGTLHRFVRLAPSSEDARPANGDAVQNQVDAAVASLDETIEHVQGYLRSRGLIAPSAVAKPRLGDEVFKVGRSTALTYGRIVNVATTVPVLYQLGKCWFWPVIRIEGIDGAQFSDKGDSGSLIVRRNGEAVGLLFAGKGNSAYACPLDTALSLLECELGR